jgi:hypothetical protein
MGHVLSHLRQSAKESWPALSRTVLEIRFNFFLFFISSLPFMIELLSVGLRIGVI